MQDEDFDLKKEYEVLKKRYNLPSFKDLDREFDIAEIEHDGFLLRRIRGRIYDKVDFFIKILENILYPNSANMASLYESKFFSEYDMDECTNILKRLMFIDRSYILLDIEEDEGKDADFIKDVFKEWQSLKNDLLKFLKIMKDSWKKEEKMPGEKEYFG